MEIRADKQYYFGSGVRLYGRHGKAKIMPVTLKKYDECELIEPFATLTAAEAQALMDSLWDCGLRPSEGSGSAGALAATQRHLEDMRKLVFEAKP